MKVRGILKGQKHLWGRRNEKNYTTPPTHIHSYGGGQTGITLVTFTRYFKQVNFISVKYTSIKLIL